MAKHNPQQGGGEAVGAGVRRPGLHRTVHMFVGLLAFWLLLMGAVDIQRIAAGSMVAAALTAFWLRGVPSESPPDDYSAMALMLRPGFLKYLGSMAWEIVRANWSVARVVLDPRLPISPTFVLVKTKLKHDLTRVIYATSITLTPGTLSVSLDDDTLIVHALTRQSAAAMRDWAVEERVLELEQAWRS